MDSRAWGGQQCVSEAGSSVPTGRVLFAAAEIHPLAKTGGLADVAGALPQALAELGADVRMIMPGYPDALEQILAPRTLFVFDQLLGVADVRVIGGRIPGSALPVWLLDCPSLFRRPGSPYQDADGVDWPDNRDRFGLFCHAVARLALGSAPVLGWQPDVVHCHDWHTGLVPLLLKSRAGHMPKSVFTIHNLAFQGNFPLANAESLGLPAEALTSEGAEFYGKLSFLKAGIRYADRITTVSPSYAREILQPDHGCGMDGLLRHRRLALHGILNGIDTDAWNPATDPHLPHGYSAANPGGKQICKRALQQRLGFDVDPRRPLAIMLSRLTGQKMADIVADRLPGLLARHPDLQFALLGQGDRALEQRFAEIGAQHVGRCAIRIGYCEAEAHRFHAGADLLVHGSRFEPCGLAQMYAMRYGTLPLVRRVGGLGDTVIDSVDDRAGATGFVFDECSGDALSAAVDRALALYRQRPIDWQQLQRNGMRSDFGWRRSARDYLHLYGLRSGSVARHSVRSTRDAIGEAALEFAGP